MSGQKYFSVLHRDLHAVADTWLRFERSGRSLAFQSFGWTTRMAESLVDGNKSLIFIETIEGRSRNPVMLLPLCLQNTFGQRRITWFDCGVVDYAAPLVSPEVHIDEDFAREAWASVVDALPSADLIHIAKIPPRFLGRPNPLALLPQCQDSKAVSYQVELKDIDGPVLRSGAKSSVFKEVARRKRRLAERGSVRFHLAATDDDAERLFDVLLQQRQERFAALGRLDLLSKERFSQFYRSAAHDGLRGGCVRLFGLTVDDIWLATAYGLESPGMFHLLIPTMREGEWRRYSPGLLLIERIMEWSRSKGHHTFDFSLGDMSYKSDLAGVPSPLYELFAIHSSRGLLMKRTTAMLASSKDWLKQRPRVFELLRRTRQQIRRGFSI